MGYFLIGMGIFTLVITLLRIPFFWGSKKTMRLRRLLGDTLASLIHYGISILLIVLGVMAFMGKLK